MKSVEVVIIGAGAAGLMCAIEAGKRGLSVAVLEKAKKPGRKILISGGGRCNFTNLDVTPENYLSENTHFCKSALSRYTQWHFIEMLSQHGLSYNEKTLGQLFCDQKAPAIVGMLLDECEAVGVHIVCNIDVTEITHDKIFTIKSAEQQYKSTSLVIATGGPSIPKMGATDFSQRVAKQFKLKTIPFRPCLVPLTFSSKEHQHLFRDLAGVALPCVVSCNGVSFRENLLITHRGLSGPAILQISSYWRKGDVISVNLLPDQGSTDLLREQLALHPDSQLSTILGRVIPKRLVQRLFELYFQNRALKQYTHSELEHIAEMLQNWQLTPDGSEGMRTAEVCAGGVNCGELSSKTFETKAIKNLYFIGEAIDVTGHLGGYNFQWAWASGWCTGQFIGS